MTRQKLVTISALTMVFVATLLAGCEQPAEKTPSTSAVTEESEPARADDEASTESAVERGMNMQAGKSLHGNFARKELVVLDNPVEVPAAFTTTLGQMYEQYRRIAQAFVTDDPGAADVAAGRMRAQVESLAADGLDAEARDAWEGHRKVLRTSLHQLTVVDDIESKREHFSHISEAMYCALQSFGGIGQQVHVAFCPMAIEGHGAYWLADKAEIENPYMGQKMASCGELKASIN